MGYFPHRKVWVELKVTFIYRHITAVWRLPSFLYLLLRSVHFLQVDVFWFDAFTFIGASTPCPLPFFVSAVIYPTYSIFINWGAVLLLMVIYYHKVNLMSMFFHKVNTF